MRGRSLLVDLLRRLCPHDERIARAAHRCSHRGAASDLPTRGWDSNTLRRLNAARFETPPANSDLLRQPPATGGDTLSFRSTAREKVMHKFTHLRAAIGLAIAPVLLAAPAQTTPLGHTWVAFGGNDTNACDRSAPCATFDGAIAKTAVGGEVTCVDSGRYNGLYITHSITINCENAIGSPS